MLLVPVGPLATGSLVWRTRKGAFSQTVVCKATFSLAPGRSLLAAQQDPAREHDVYAGLDPARWLWAPADLVPYKMRADVVLVGHAHAPGDAPVRSLRVRLVVAGIDKSLEVRCDRRRALDGRVLEGTPAARFPLGWDRAAYAPSNPVGVIAGRAPDAYGTVPLPSVGWPDEATRPRPDALVAGFGPIAPWWPGRIEKLGRYRAAALQPSWQGAALPEDADDALFQVAPADQQVPRLEAEPRLMLENLLAGHPRLETQLALVTPHARVERPGRAPEPLSLVADTLWIDTDRGVCTVTWRGWLMLSHADEAGTVRLWADGVEVRAAAPVPVASGDAPARPEVPARAGFDPRETSAVDPMAVLTGVRALPFAGPPSAPPNVGAAPSQGPSAPVFGAPPLPAPSAPPLAGAPPSPASDPSPAAPAPRRWDPRETAAVDPSSLGPGLLPFAAAPEGAPPPAFERSAPAPRRFDPRETSAVDPAVALAALGVLPFGARGATGAEEAPPLAAPVAVSPPLAVPPPPVRVPAALVEEAPSEDRSTNPLEIAPFDVPPPAWLGPPPADPTGTEAVAGAAPAEIAPPPLLGSVPAEIAPPPLLGHAPAEAAPPASRAETAPAEGGGARRAELERKWRARESLEGIDLSGLSLAGIDLSGASLIGASLEKVDLSNAKLSGANLTRARLSGARFGGADLTGATLAYSAGAGASFVGALLARANVRAGELRDADFSGADVSEARFDGAVLDGSGFSQVKGAGSSWDRASLAKCAFSGADLRGASFVEAACARADFARSQLGKASFRAARCEGASFEEVDAANARLLDVSAPSASFRKAKLEGAQLRGAKLAKSSFTEAVLRRSMADGADFSSADLGRADFGRASLREASFREATLVEATLEGADLRGADLTRANATRAALGSAKLDGIKKDGAEGI